MNWRPIRRSSARKLLRVCCNPECRRVFNWRAAKYVGPMQDDIERLELKNCPSCKSTNAMVVAVSEKAA